MKSKTVKKLENELTQEIKDKVDNQSLFRHLKLDVDKQGNPVLNNFTKDILQFHLEFEKNYLKTIPKGCIDRHIIEQEIILIQKLLKTK